jgi:hypothetical protein
MVWFFAGFAYATGFMTPPVIQHRGEDCKSHSETANLAFTYASTQGSCAPGGPCSSVSVPEDPSDFLLFRPDCEPPLMGRVRPTERVCDGLPVWEWDGAIPSGRDLVLRLDGNLDSTSAIIRSVGVAKSADICPPPSNIVARPDPPAQVRKQHVDQRLVFPRDTFSLRLHSEDLAQVTWTGGTTHSQWAYGAVLESEVMPVAIAERLLNEQFEGEDEAVTFTTGDVTTSCTGQLKRGVEYRREVREIGYAVTLKDGTKLSGKAVFDAGFILGVCLI